MFHISSVAEDWCDDDDDNALDAAKVNITMLLPQILETLAFLPDFLTSCPKSRNSNWLGSKSGKTLWYIYFVNYSYCHFQTFMLQMGKVLKSKVLKLSQCVIFHQVTYYISPP